MLQRLIAALIGLLGLAAAALGIASATAWKADDPLVASATADTSTLVTEPGVLEVAGKPVTVTIAASGSPVVLAIGRDTDVEAWIGTDPHEVVTGLADWHVLALSTADPEPAPSPSAGASAEPEAADPSPSASAAEEGSTEPTAADPTGSDMWIVEATGEDTTSLTWTAPESGRWSLIAVSLGDTAPTLELSWPQEVTTPWLWPGVAAGVLLLLISVVWWIRIRRQAAGADWHDVSTGMLHTVDAPERTGTGTTPVALPSRSTGTSVPSEAPTTVIGAVGATTPQSGQPLTRRQLREAEAAAQAAQAARRRGRRAGAEDTAAADSGAQPVVPGGSPAGPVPGTGAAAGAAPTSPSATGDVPTRARSRRESAEGRPVDATLTDAAPVPADSGEAPTASGRTPFWRRGRATPLVEPTPTREPAAAEPQTTPAARGTDVSTLAGPAGVPPAGSPGAPVIGSPVSQGGGAPVGWGSTVIPADRPASQPSSASPVPGTPSTPAGWPTATPPAAPGGAVPGEATPPAPPATRSRRRGPKPVAATGWTDTGTAPGAGTPEGGRPQESTASTGEASPAPVTWGSALTRMAPTGLGPATGATPVVDPARTASSGSPSGPSPSGAPGSAGGITPGYGSRVPEGPGRHPDAHGTTPGSLAGDPAPGTLAPAAQSGSRSARGSRLPWRRKRGGVPAGPSAPEAVSQEPATSVAGAHRPDDGSAPPVPGVDAPDENLSGAQRADAWRQMWGFPLEGPGETGASPGSAGPDDQPRTDPEEGR